MTDKGKWTKEKAIEALQRNKYKVDGDSLEVYGAGLHLLGAVDYLVKHHSYVRAIGEGRKYETRKY